MSCFRTKDPWCLGMDFYAADFCAAGYCYGLFDGFSMIFFVMCDDVFGSCFNDTDGRVKMARGPVHNDWERRCRSMEESCVEIFERGVRQQQRKWRQERNNNIDKCRETNPGLPVQGPFDQPVGRDSVQRALRRRKHLNKSAQLEENKACCSKRGLRWAAAIRLRKINRTQKRRQSRQEYSVFKRHMLNAHSGLATPKQQLKTRKKLNFHSVDRLNNSYAFQWKSPSPGFILDFDTNLTLNWFSLSLACVGQEVLRAGCW